MQRNWHHHTFYHHTVRPSLSLFLSFFVWFIIKFLLEKVILINDKTNRDHGYAGGVGKGLDTHCIEKSALMSGVTKYFSLQHNPKDVLYTTVNK